MKLLKAWRAELLGGDGVGGLKVQGCTRYLMQRNKLFAFNFWSYELHSATKCGELTGCQGALRGKREKVIQNHPTLLMLVKERKKHLRRPSVQLRNSTESIQRRRKWRVVSISMWN